METATVVREVHLGPAANEREGVSPGEETPLGPSLPSASSLSLDSRDGADPPRRRTPLLVRNVQATDLAALRRLGVVHRFNQPETHLAPYSPLRSGLRAVVPGRRGQRPLFVACDREQVVGYAQFEPVRPDQRWVLIALGASGGFDGGETWESLLVHSVTSAGSRGVKRLYARVPHGSPIGDALRRVGWAPYATETIYAMPGSMGRAEPSPRLTLRRQEQTDTWAIHQLYNAAVPRQVQYAEAFTSHRWDAGRRRGGRDAMAIGWLVEEEHHVLGHVRTSSRGGIHVLELVYHPERADVLETLVDGALARLAKPSKRIYCAVRGYQAEAATVLVDRGFAPVLEQELHIKYTTANVRLPSWEATPFRVEVRDKLPQRVPTFLHGQPRDESAT